MKGYLIDATARTVTEVDYEYGTMQRWLPGGIEIGWVYDNYDVLYVDGEGLLRPAEKAFRIKARPDGQPMMSNGFVTGADGYENGKGTTLPPRFTIADIEARIEWLTVSEALNWFRHQGTRTAVSLVEEGTGQSQTAAGWHEILANLEGHKGYDPKTNRVVDDWLHGRRPVA